MNEYFMPKKLILYVPGFPGEAIPRKIGETRILDIVSAIVALKNINFEVISYTGIRDGRVFTFENTKIHVFNVTRKIFTSATPYLSC